MSQDTDAYEVAVNYNRDRTNKCPPGWTEGDVERLVARVSERVMNNFYEEVGRSLVKRVLQYVGWASVIGLTLMGAMKGKQWLS